MDCFTDFFPTFLGLESVSCLAVNCHCFYICILRLNKVFKVWKYFKGEKTVISSKNVISVINYSPICSSKPIIPTFILRKQIKIFLMKSEKISPLQYSNETDHFISQKGRKDIIKVVHVWLRWFNLNFLKQWKKNFLTFLGLESVSFIVVYEGLKSPQI